jgi:RNA polymerase sigma factor (sigma-70 family)
MSALLRHVRRLGRPAVALTDRQLVQRFTAERDEAAFAELVGRHGALVLNVCRRTLRREQDAEDAFQATFLVLAKKAATIRKGESVACWLYGVAWRCAGRLRRDLAQRRRHERSTMPAAVAEAADPSWREVQEALHEELARLPEKYRAPLVLCYLEGRTQSEAARQLGWGEEILRGRVDRGREQLRRRLICRGITLSAALLAATVLPTAPASAALVQTTARLTAGPVRASVAALANAICRGLFIARLRLVMLLVAATVAVSAFGYQLAAVGEQAQEDDKPTAAKRIAEDRQPKTDLYGDSLPEGAVARLGTVRWRRNGGYACLAFSPDGKTLVTGGSSLQVWDLATGKQLRHSDARMARRFAASLWPVVA